MQYIGIIKGINVGGHKKIIMADLRSYLKQINLSEIKTYIQSGNIVFKSSEEEISKIENQIQEKIREHYNFDVSVIVISAQNFKAVINDNPYPEEDLKRLHCCFFETQPIIQNLQKLEIFDASPDKFVIANDHLYIRCATERYSQSKINNNVAEKLLKVNCTTRNWKTCLKLLEMLD